MCGGEVSGECRGVKKGRGGMEKCGEVWRLWGSSND